MPELQTAFEPYQFDQAVTFKNTVTFSGGSSLLSITDDQSLVFGTGNDVKLAWGTSDANANELLLEMPAGTAVNVPVLVVGQSIRSVDLGLYNGVVDPRIALLGVGAVTTGTGLDFRKARGTAAAPTVVTAGDDLGTIRFYGCVANAEYVLGAEIRADAAATQATTRGPATLTFLTATDAAPSVLTAALILGKDQNVTIGGGAATQTLTFDVATTDVVLSASAAALSFGAITVNVTGTRWVQSYHTNITSTNAVTVDSSLRSKADVQDYTGDASAIVNAIRVVDFAHRIDVDPTGQRKLGVIAETIGEPLAINPIPDPSGDGEYPGVNLMALLALVVRNQQQQDARLVALETRH